MVHAPNPTIAPAFLIKVIMRYGRPPVCGATFCSGVSAVHTAQITRPSASKIFA